MVVVVSQVSDGIALCNVSQGFKHLDIVGIKQELQLIVGVTGVKGVLGEDLLSSIRAVDSQVLEAHTCTPNWQGLSRIINGLDPLINLATKLQIFRAPVSSTVENTIEMIKFIELLLHIFIVEYERHCPGAGGF